MKVGPRWSLLAAAAVAAILPLRAAAASPARPYDAPLVDVQRNPVPEVTLGYETSEEAGVKLVSVPAAAARALLPRALAARTDLKAELGRDVLGAVEIRVAKVQPQLSQLAPAALPAGTSAAAFAGAGLVVMSLGGGLEPTDLDARLRHELAHLALDEAALGREVPRWFHEGYALHVSGEDAAARAEALTLASLRDQIMDLHEVDLRFPDGPPGSSLAAAEAADFVRFLIDQPGHGAFHAFVEQLRGGDSFEDAIGHAYGARFDDVELAWRRDVAKRYGFVPVLSGATLLWVLVALGVIVQARRLAARRERPFYVGGGPTPRAPREPYEAPLPAAERLAARQLDHPRLRAEDDELAQAIPPDPEVPKVEHDGRWYTLH